MTTNECTDPRLVRFFNDLCQYFEELQIRRLSPGESFDPENEVIFDPENEVIFDPENEVIFDPGRSFNPEDGILFSSISGDLYDSYGHKINKLQSFEGFMKLICWLLKRDEFSLVESTATEDT